MRKRNLGFTDLELTVIGLGTWAIGGGGWQYAWGPQDDELSIQTIHRAMDLGINWIDTAAVYGLGHSEEIVGKAIKGMKERPIIATKCERTWDKAGNIGGTLKKESIKREAEASLKRLGVDRIDLYQIHWPQPDSDIEEGWTAISELIGEGKVRHGGVSNFSLKQIERIKGIYPVASLQPPYSMIVPYIEKELLGYCYENCIGVICYSPMYKGLLTGAFTRARAEGLPQDDHRRDDSHFQEPELDINIGFVEKLGAIAAREGKTVSQLAIAWTLRRKEVTAAIVGARKPGQIEETYAAGDWELGEGIIAEIDGLLKLREQEIRASSGK